MDMLLCRYKGKLLVPQIDHQQIIHTFSTCPLYYHSIFIMKSGLALAALAFGGMSLAQSTTAVATSAVDIDGQTTTLVSNIDPSDIAAIPEPEVLGPPIGVYESVSSATYNEAQATASVLALVVEATDAQTAVITPESTAIAATKTPVPVSSEAAAARKRSYVGGLTGNLQRRDLSYPIDTSSYVSHIFHKIESVVMLTKL